jgi:hypothetical protein
MNSAGTVILRIIGVAVMGSLITMWVNRKRDNEDWQKWKD